MYAAYAERALRLGLLALLAGCAQDDPEPITQVMVTVSGDADVLAQLTRIEARIYRTEALFDPQPMVAHTFKLPATMPLSFGVVQRDAPRFLLVLEGYGAEDGRPPIIERKVRAEFTGDRTMQLDVRLASACLQLPNPCRDLEHTCRADLRACGPIDPVAMRATENGKVLPPEAAVRPPVAEACRDVSCPAEYPCTPTLAGGHVCLGQFADWPMPDATPGALHRPKYDLSTEGIVRDEVTGLSWQREPPASYPGCPRRHLLHGERGSGCTVDEAKLYCDGLTLGGLAWRLPSRIELTSIVDMQATPTVSPEVFRGCTSWTWSSSLDVVTRGEEVQNVWLLSPEDGTTAVFIPSLPFCVRCVSGVPTSPGSGSARYAVEADTVRDVFTGLRWQRIISGPLATVEEASAHCASEGSGFRLPTLKELTTLVDTTRRVPAIDPIFADTPGAPFWASPASTEKSSAKAISFLVGNFESLETPAWTTTMEEAHPRARCVR